MSALPMQCNVDMSRFPKLSVGYVGKLIDPAAYTLVCVGLNHLGWVRGS